MPSGNTHTRIAVMAAAAVIISGTAAPLYLDLGKWTPSLMELSTAAAGVMTGDLFLSPDLDGAASNCKRRWGPLRFIWRLYEKLPHRSPLSHWPIIGDAGRLLYLGLVLTPVSLGAGLAHDGAQGAILDSFWVINQAQAFILTYPRETGAWFAGLCLATALHGLADMIVSEGKKMVDFDEPVRRKGGRPRKRQPASAPISRKQRERMAREEGRRPAQIG